MTTEQHSRRFFYLYPGATVAYDIWAKNEKDARAQLRRRLGVKRLSNGYQVWAA